LEKSLNKRSRLPNPKVCEEWKPETMNQTHAYKVNLTKINGDGDFPCPRCGSIMSPDDEWEKAYSILGSKATNDGLEEIVIRCNKCSSHVHLTGFSLLQTLIQNDEEAKRNPKDQSIYHISRA